MSDPSVKMKHRQLSKTPIADPKGKQGNLLLSNQAVPFVEAFGQVKCEVLLPRIRQLLHGRPHGYTLHLGGSGNSSGDLFQAIVAQ